MLTTILAFVISFAGAQELTLERRFEHRFDSQGWNVFVHGQKLVALNRNTLQVEVLDAQSGATLLADRLDSEKMSPLKVDTLSAPSLGEFHIAFASADDMVEWHSVNRDAAYEVHIDSTPISLKLVEVRGGEVYLVVATAREVAIYRRSGGTLAVVNSLRSSAGFKQVQAERSATGLLVLTLHERNSHVRVAQLDVAGGLHEDFSLQRASVRLESTVDRATNDYISALIGAQSVRFFIEGQRGDSRAYPAEPRLGASQWVRDSQSRPLFASANRVNGVTQLTLFDPRNLAESVTLGAGDARSISDVGTFKLNGKIYYYYIRDARYLTIQNEGELSSLPVRDGERLVSVQLVKATRSLAIVLESDRGTRVVRYALPFPGHGASKG